MPTPVTLTNQQKVSAGITILDDDGQPYAEVPAGATVEFSTSDSTIAPIEVQPDGLNIVIRTGKVGAAVVTCKASLANGKSLEDTLAVAVKNSDPNSLNFTVGTPESE